VLKRRGAELARPVVLDVARTPAAPLITAASAPLRAQGATRLPRRAQPAPPPAHARASRGAA
jgi:hypothetical protein